MTTLIIAAAPVSVNDASNNNPIENPKTQNHSDAVMEALNFINSAWGLLSQNSSITLRTVRAKVEEIAHLEEQLGDDLPLTFYQQKAAILEKMKLLERSKKRSFAEASAQETPAEETDLSQKPTINWKSSNSEKVAAAREVLEARKGEDQIYLTRKELQRIQKSKSIYNKKPAFIQQLIRDKVPVITESEGKTTVETLSEVQQKGEGHVQFYATPELEKYASWRYFPTFPKVRFLSKTKESEAAKRPLKKKSPLIKTHLKAEQILAEHASYPTCTIPLQLWKNIFKTPQEKAFKTMLRTHKVPVILSSTDENPDEKESVVENISHYVNAKRNISLGKIVFNNENDRPISFYVTQIMLEEVEALRNIEITSLKGFQIFRMSLKNFKPTPPVSLNNFELLKKLNERPVKRSEARPKATEPKHAVVKEDQITVKLLLDLSSS